MFSPNPYSRALAIIGYSGIILGVILTSIGAAEAVQILIFGMALLLAGVLSLIGYLVVGGLTWRRLPPSA